MDNFMDKLTEKINIQINPLNKAEGAMQGQHSLKNTASDFGGQAGYAQGQQGQAGIYFSGDTQSITADIKELRLLIKEYNDKEIVLIMELMKQNKEELQNGIISLAEAINTNRAYIAGIVDAMNHNRSDVAGALSEAMNKNKADIEKVLQSLESNKAAVLQIADAANQSNSQINDMLQAVNSNKAYMSSIMEAIGNNKPETIDVSPLLNNHKLEIMKAIQNNSTETVNMLKEISSEKAVQETRQEQPQPEQQFKDLEEHVHRESVRCYRNIQAVVAEQVAGNSSSVYKQIAVVKVLAILAAVASFVNIGLVVAGILGLF